VHQFVSAGGEEDCAFDNVGAAGDASSTEEGGVVVADLNGSSAFVVALYGGLSWGFLRHWRDGFVTRHFFSLLRSCVSLLNQV
jgi:hypothetical protein